MACPGVQQLEALLRAQVKPHEEAQLTAHVDACRECQRRLEALAGGVGLIPSQTAGGLVEPSRPAPGLNQAIEKLRQVQLWGRGEPKVHLPAPPDEAITTKDPTQAGGSSAPTRLNSPSANPPACNANDRTGDTPWWRKRFAGATLCVLLGVVWLLLDAEPRDWKFRALSYDLPIRLRGPIRPDDVLIVSMDWDLQRKLNLVRPNQWSRARHAQLLQHALTLGAKLIVFDITFTDPRDDADEDQRFANALRDAPGKVVLGAALIEREVGGNSFQSSPQTPAEVFQKVAAWGLATVETNRDGRVRQHYVDPNGAHPSLAWKAVELLGKAPADPWRRRWMNYYGPRTILPSIPYDNFLEQPVTETNLLAGRTVFVGWNPAKPDGKDEYATSFTHQPEDTVTGVQVHATAFLNLLRREWLEELPWPLNCLLVLGLGLAFPLGLSRLRLRWALACSLAGFFLLMVGACLLTWFEHKWFPWLIGGAVQIPFALLWSRLAHVPGFNAPRLQQPSASTGVENRSAPPAVEPRRLPEIPDHVPIRCVGRGAYGEVWLARDILGSFHAVKVVYRNTFVHDEPFEREFRGIQRFTPISRLHPGWIHVLHVGRHDAQGYFYYIMELGDDETTGQQVNPDRYVPKTLAGELHKRGRLPVEDCLMLGVALADALEHLHKHALIHRDIKPSNVIFVRGAPKFTDIGLVTDFKSQREISWIGTEGYMPPEGPGTPSADVFGLGKLIYEAASGRDRETFPNMPTALSEQLPAGDWEQFRRILLKACEEDPSKRYASASDLHGDLAQLLNRLKSRGMG